MSISNLTQFSRSKGDPRVQETGPSSLGGADELARALGWFSICLGVTEILAAGQICRTLGLEGKEALIRSYGVRELASAVPTLSIDKSVGLASRIAGDALDLATLSAALRPDNPKRDNAALATALVAGITILDIAAYAGTKVVHRRRGSGSRDYSGRSGLPRGPQASRGLARKDFTIPLDYRAEGTVADALPAPPS